MNYRTGYVDFSTKSHELFTETIKILNTVGIRPDFISKQADHFGRWVIRFRKHENLRKCLALFEPMTKKWMRLSDHVFGPSGNARDMGELLKKFDNAYPRVNSRALTFSDVIRAVQKLKKPTSGEVSSCIERGYTTTYEFLRKLERWGVLNSGNQFQNMYRKIWEINENCEEWRVPI